MHGTDRLSVRRCGGRDLDDIVALDDELAQKLCATVTDNLGELTERLRATVRLSQSYQAFAGLSDSMDGQVKFIYRTDEIDANERKKGRQCPFFIPSDIL